MKLRGSITVHSRAVSCSHVATTNMPALSAALSRRAAHACTSPNSRTLVVTAAAWAFRIRSSPPIGRSGETDFGSDHTDSPQRKCNQSESSSKNCRWIPPGAGWIASRIGDAVVKRRILSPRARSGRSDAHSTHQAIVVGHGSGTASGSRSSHAREALTERRIPHQKNDLTQGLRSARVIQPLLERTHLSRVPR